MRVRKKLTEYGAPAQTSKTPSPRPVTEHERRLPKIHSAPTAVFHEAQNAMPILFPVIYDAEVEELARLPFDWVHACKISSVVLLLMNDFVYDPEFEKRIANIDEKEIIMDKAKDLGIVVTLNHVIAIIADITKDKCPPAADLYARLDYLKNAILRREIDFANALTYRDRTLLESFTESFRALSTERQKHLDELMTKHIKRLKHHEISLFIEWLAYAARPNIPGEEMPRLPEAAVAKLVKRLNNPPKDLSDLKSIITDYLGLAKKPDSNQAACRALLVTFSAQYTQLEEAAKREVMDTITKRLQKTTTHDVTYLHEILEFAGSKLPENKDHIFPTQVSFAISKTVHDHQLCLRLGNILQVAIAHAKENVDTMSIFMQFINDFRNLSQTTQIKITQTIINQIYFQISKEDFLGHKAQIELLQTILRDQNLDHAIIEKEKLLHNLQTEEADLKVLSPTANAGSITTIGMFTPPQPVTPSDKRTVLKK